MRLAWILLSLSACMADPSPARARPNPEEALERADLDADGMITRGEFRDHRNRQFARFDRDGDGQLSPDDLPRRARRAGQERLGQLIAQFDRDRDGQISHREFIDGPSRAFDRADTDRDNRVDARELRAFQAALPGG